MRFHSTPESALNGEITVLAIIECIVSVSVYLAICIHFKSFKYLAWPIAVVPLMLFRTEASAEWGLKTFRQFIQFGDHLVDRVPREPLYFLVALFPAYLAGVFVVPVVAAVIRVVATAYWTVRKPVRALKETPQNWLRQAICTDFFQPPEILPLQTTDDLPGFTELLLGRGTGNVKSFSLLYPLICVPFLVIGYFPPLFYRISFKATAGVYFPFVWAARAVLHNPITLKFDLNESPKANSKKSDAMQHGLLCLPYSERSL